MKRLVPIAVFLLALCGVVHAEDGYVRLTIKGENVNLRPEPQAGGAIVAKVNAGNVFIAEKWPITDKSGSDWYRMVFRLDAKSGGIVPFWGVFSYYDAELEANVSPRVAFVSARFVDATPLASGDMKQIMETPEGEGFSGLDISPKNQRRMALDKGGVYCVSDLFPEGSKIKEYAVYRASSTKTGQKKYPITEENEYLGTMFVTDKSTPGLLQIIGSNSRYSSGWIKANPKVWQNEGFSLAEFMSLSLGANVPEIMRKWGPGKIVSRSINLTKMSFDGMEIAFNDDRNFKFTLSRKGTGLGGIFIGESWCDKDYLKRMFAHVSPEQIQVGKQGGAEQWTLNLGRDGWIYSYEILFGADGLVKELRFECQDVFLG